MPPSSKFERPKAKPSSILRRLGRYLLRHRLLMVGAVILSVAGNLLGLLSPRLSGLAIDSIMPENVDFPVVYKYVLGRVIVALLSSMMGYLLSKMMIT